MAASGPRTEHTVRNVQNVSPGSSKIVHHRGGKPTSWGVLANLIIAVSSGKARRTELVPNAKALFRASPHVCELWLDGPSESQVCDEDIPDKRKVENSRIQVEGGCSWCRSARSECPGHFKLLLPRACVCPRLQEPSPQQGKGEVRSGS